MTFPEPEYCMQQQQVYNTKNLNVIENHSWEKETFYL